MPKKMHDILPPKLAHKVENTIKDLEGTKKKRKPAQKEVKALETKKAPQPVLAHLQKKRRFPLAELLVGGGVIVVLLCIYGFFKLPKANVQIWPKTDTLTLSEKITADKSVNSINFIGKVIPAQYVEVAQDNWQSFPATGSASDGGKATGTITVYNKISPASPLSLKAGTHFLSDSGKYFITLAKIVVPAPKNNTPGSVSVQVQAQDSGTDYNIDPSKFSVPGLNGTSYYYSVYAESTKAMTGGYTGKIKKVTDDDIKNAQDVLTKKLLDLVQVSIKDKIGPDQVLLDGATVSTVVSAGSSVKSGAVVDNFNEQAKVKVSAIVFKKQDIQDFLTQDITSQCPPDNKILKNSLAIKYNSENIDVQSGKLVIDMQVSGTTYPVIDTKSLIDVFAAKSANQIKQAVDQMYGGKVTQLKVNFWPFWVTSAPSDKGRIKAELQF